MTDVHVVVPGDIDDPRRPSGGNRYDRRICAGLAATGWSVREHPVPGDWPRPDSAARARLADALGGLPDGALVVVDGLVASACAAELVPATGRLRLVVLVHMPLGEGASGDTRTAERAVLASAAAVVATSRWTRRRLDQLYALPGGSHVVEPGAELGAIAPGTAGGGELLCVAALTPAKGHDVLLAALARVRDLPWRCACVGSLELRPDFVADLLGRAYDLGIADRVSFPGPLIGRELDAAYAAADLLVLPSRAETYGMVVAEALAHGVPTVASEVGGVPEALGRSVDGALPGALVPAGDPTALADVLRRWLTDDAHRRLLRSAARSRRSTLAGWSQGVDRMSRILAETLAEPGRGGARMNR